MTPSGSGQGYGTALPSPPHLAAHELHAPSAFGLRVVGMMHGQDLELACANAAVHIANVSVYVTGTHACVPLLCSRLALEGPISRAV